jgi:peptidoglycan-associated lipoprotein
MEPPGPAVPADSTARTTQLPVSPSGTELTDRRDINNYFQDRDTFKQQTVYFDFDRYNVKTSELPKLQAVADRLKGQSSDAVLVEGHCDERGTPEYNRALGERRADSIRESLINLGIAADRIHTISYGEDKPVDLGHNDAAWAKNRRGEFVLLKPKTGGSSAEAR